MKSRMKKAARKHRRVYQAGVVARAAEGWKPGESTSLQAPGSEGNKARYEVWEEEKEVGYEVWENTALQEEQNYGRVMQGV